MISRQDLRRSIQQQRRQLPATLRQQASAAICNYIATTSWFRRSHHLAFYWPVQGEIDAVVLLEQAWEMGKSCYLPVCNPEKNPALLFFPYSPGEPLEPNLYGILEPCSGNRNAMRKPWLLDVVFTPLVAFDADGNRLGSGKGYYDKTFNYLNRQNYLRKPRLVGLAYQFQRTDQLLVTQPWDVGLERVIVYDLEQGRVEEKIGVDSLVAGRY